MQEWELAQGCRICLLTSLAPACLLTHTHTLDWIPTADLPLYTHTVTCAAVQARLV